MPFARMFTRLQTILRNLGKPLQKVGSLGASNDGSLRPYAEVAEVDVGTTGERWNGAKGGEGHAPFQHSWDLELIVCLTVD